MTSADVALQLLLDKGIVDAAVEATRTELADSESGDNTPPSWKSWSPTTTVEPMHRRALGEFNMDVIDLSVSAPERGT